MSLWNRLLLILVLSFGAFTRSQAATLVYDGQPRAVIILADSPSPAAREAARVLQEHLRQISGATLPILAEHQVSSAPTSERGWVLVGESRLTEKAGMSAAGLGPGGMLLKAKGDLLVLLGPDLLTPTDSDGTLHAVTTFLEEKLGVRYLWPGESGKVVPSRKTITVEDFERAFTPRLGQRVIRDIRFNDRTRTGLERLGFTVEDFKRRQAAVEKTQSVSPDWFRWHKLGGSLKIRSGHAFGEFWKRHGKRHPEWFALQPDGSRDQSRDPERAQLCTSNAQLIETVAKEKIAELDENPDLLGVSIAPNDGGRISFCGCASCEALDAPLAPVVTLEDFSGWKTKTYKHAALTDRMVYFWNAVAEKVAAARPGKLLVVDAYSAYSTPPISRKLHPNLVVRFVPMDYLDEPERKEALDYWQKWSDAAKRIFFRPNFLYTGRSGAAHLYFHKFAKDFRFMAGHGMMGTDFDGCLHHWSTQGLAYYVVARLNWNPSQDVDDLVDDYCRAGFGPAAKLVREYFNRLETLTDKAAEKDIDPLEPFSPEEIAALQGILKRARVKAAGDSAVGKRIDFVETGLRWTDIEAQAHALLREPGKSTGASKAKDILTERRALMRDIFRNNFLAVNVAVVSWGEDGLWSRQMPTWKEIRKRLP